MRSKRNQPLALDLPAEGPSGTSASGETPGPAAVRPPPAEHVAAMAALKAKEARRAGRAPKRAEAKPAPAPKVRDAANWSRYAYPVGIAASLTWAGGLVAFVLGFQSRFGAFDYGALQWVVIGALAMLPSAFILLAAYALRQGARLAGETRRARALAEDLAIPALLAADQTGGAFEAMRREIERASDAADDARNPIIALRETLAEESRKLALSAAEAQATGRMLADTLARERAALADMAKALQAQAAEAAEALSVQQRVVADASDLAQVQLQEAQAALAMRAADLATAAGEAGDTAILAGDQLSRQVERLETAGTSLTERMEKLQLTISAEREQLAGLTDGLRADQEDMAVQIETRRAQLAQASAEARDGAAAVGEAAEAGAAALRGLIASAAEEVRNLAEAAQREQETLDAQARAAVSLFTGLVAEERTALEEQTRAAIGHLAAAAEEARAAAAGHVEAAAQAASSHVQSAKADMEALAESVAARIDHLGEAAFAAGQKADQAFEARMAAARRLIEESVALVNESGQVSSQRMELGLATARTALQDMDSLLFSIDARFAKLPEEARQRAEAVREAVERGVGDLTAAARRAAEETQAIDAAFQERVRRNYEVLAEAVRLMGRVAGAAEGQPSGRPAPPIQTPPLQAPPLERERALERPPVEIRPAVAVGERGLHVPVNDEAAAARAPLRPAALSEPLSTVMEPRRAEPAPAPSPAAAAGLRPRLRLTPAPVEDPADIFEPLPTSAAPEPGEAAPATEEGADDWTWKDLLSSMDQPVDDEVLAERLMDEITALGIDAGALLPRARIDEIAVVLQAGDIAGAREVVRRLAPAAVRRLSRRVLTDKVLRTETDRYVQRYQALLKESAARDREGYMTAALLGSDPGRAFLLLDAAVGDLN